MSISFFESELLALSSHHKPIVLVIDPAVNQLPNTAFEGYPVFDATSLKRDAYVPLVLFLQLLTKHWRRLRRMYARAARVGAKRMVVVFKYTLIGSFVLGTLLEGFELLQFSVLTSFLVMMLRVALFVSTGAFLAGFGHALMTRYKALASARQLVLNRQVPDPRFLEALGELDETMALCLMPAPVIPHDVTACLRVTCPEDSRLSISACDVGQRWRELIGGDRRPDLHQIQHAPKRCPRLY